jgi:hypothetical protein
MEDPRSLYINQIINHYRKSVFDDIDCYTVGYKYPSSNNIGGWLVLHHNEGLDIVSEYIKDLEKKIDELQYIERIIKLAKENRDERI